MPSPTPSRRQLAGPLFWGFILPLAVVYIAEYTVNQGILPVLDVLPPAAAGVGRRDSSRLGDAVLAAGWPPPAPAAAFLGRPPTAAPRYVQLSLVYQVAVFAGRSSHGLTPPPLYGLAAVQLAIACTLLAHTGGLTPAAPTPGGLLPAWAVTAAVAAQGLVGGGAYVTAFAGVSAWAGRIDGRVREWALGAVSVGDAAGIAAASLLDVWLECALRRRAGVTC